MKAGFKAFILWFKQIFEGPDGKPSWKPVASVAIVIVFLRTYLHISLEKNEIQDIPDMWAIFIAALLGLGIVDTFIKRKYSNGNDSGTKV